LLIGLVAILFSHGRAEPASISNWVPRARRADCFQENYDRLLFDLHCRNCLDHLFSAEQLTLEHNLDRFRGAAPLLGDDLTIMGIRRES
jgi:hypothetical protein